MMSKAVLAALLVVGFAATGAAQTDRPKGRAAVVMGSGQTWDDEGSIGKGLNVGGRVDWRVLGNTSVEGAVELLSHERSGGFYEAEGTSVLLSASLVHRFGDWRAQPYVLEGLTLLHHSGETRFDNLRFEDSSTNPGFHFGGGLAVRVTDRFEIGPEVRFYMLRIDSDSEPAWASWFGVRAGLRF
jgi:opacity protein-like surface antigen